MRAAQFVGRGPFNLPSIVGPLSRKKLGSVSQRRQLANANFGTALYRTMGGASAPAPGAIEGRTDQAGGFARRDAKAKLAGTGTDGNCIAKGMAGSAIDACPRARVAR